MDNSNQSINHILNLPIKAKAPQETYQARAYSDNASASTIY
jgi:hypothetical protein